MNRASAKSALLFFGLYIMLCIPAAGQRDFRERYLSRTLDVEDGMPCNYTDDVMRDSYGFLWVATSGGGVCRWDGYRQITFHAGSVISIKSNFVKNLAEDGFRRLWIGSEGGIDILDLETLEKSSLSLPFRCQDIPCQYLTLDAEGALWCDLERRLYRVSFTSDGEVNTVQIFEDDLIPPGNFVFQDVDGDGSVWASLGGRLHKIVPDAGGGLRAQPLATALDIGRDTYLSAFLPEEDRVWVGTEEGLYLLHRGSGGFKRYVHEPGKDNTLTQNFVTGITRAFSGELVISTLYGFNVYNPVSDDFTRSGSEVVNCIKASGEGLLVGTENQGIQILTPKPISIVELPAKGPVNALWENAAGVWVGVQEGGLRILDESAGTLVHITVERGGLSHNSVSEITPGSGDLVYVGTWGGGIDLLSGTPPFRVSGHLPPLDTRLQYIGALKWDPYNNLLWIGSNQGVFLWDPALRTYVPVLGEGEAMGCIGSCLDREGQLWMGCQQGLYVFSLRERLPDGSFPHVHYRYKLDNPSSLAGEKICSILEASDGSIWLASNGSGIYRALPPEEGGISFRGYSVENGLSSGRARALCEGPDGRIWISTENGLNVLDPMSGSILAYRRESGVENPQFFWNAALALGDGRLLFGNTTGLSAVDASRGETSLKGIPLCFTGVEIGGRTYWNPVLKEVKARQGDHSLRFRFAALAVGASSRVSYIYRMGGFDKQWQLVPPGGNEAVYSSLPAGRHRLEVVAQDHTGDILAKESLVVDVAAFFYNTWWFRLLTVLMVAAAGWGVIALRTRSLRRRQAALEHTIEERTREIRTQKRLVEQKAEELDRQNAVLRHRNEELASRKILLSPAARRSAGEQGGQFMEKALEVLREQYKDPELDVAAFCQAMGMSKTLLNTRLQEAVGESPAQFIRTYRLAVAREMMESGQGLNVSEVAYEVGFNDPKYFTRCFTKAFGMAPSTFGKGHKLQEQPVQ